MAYGSLHYSEDGKSAARYGYGITPMYKLDEATGLPEVLDEGAYFEVVRDDFDKSHIYIRYMLPRRWWFPKKLHEMGEYSGVHEVSSKHILINALHLVERREHSLKMKNDPEYRAEYKAKERAKKEENKKKEEKKTTQSDTSRQRREREQRLLGKYPPKKLGEN